MKYILLILLLFTACVDEQKLVDQCESIVNDKYDELVQQCETIQNSLVEYIGELLTQIQQNQTDQTHTILTSLGCRLNNGMYDCTGSALCKPSIYPY